MLTDAIDVTERYSYTCDRCDVTLPLVANSLYTYLSTSITSFDASLFSFGDRLYADFASPMPHNAPTRRGPSHRLTAVYLSYNSPSCLPRHDSMLSPEEITLTISLRYACLIIHPLVSLGMFEGEVPSMERRNLMRSVDPKTHQRCYSA